ncbi:MAG: sugar phosphate isomerase/epimerase [Planctomycetota bacterium]|nr:sugar phosphate isomerase/epimerase [Planctomycetota bacterium]
MPTRRSFLAGAAALGAASLLPNLACKRPNTMHDDAAPSGLLFDISLAEWSLHRALYGGELDHLDFAKVAREDYGIGAVEYVNSFFKDKAADEAYLAEMNRRCADHDVESVLIMVDGEGSLGGDDREQAILNHHRWIDAAAALGCHAIRVNAGGAGSREEVAARAADSLHRLAERGAGSGISVVVENHGGYSSDGSWLADVMRRADHPGVGTLPDFGNFLVRGEDKERGMDAIWYDRYVGVTELMPYAKAVSAKSHDFDEAGNETRTDYARMLGIVVAAGYRGYVGVEYEGGGLPEPEGIRLTKVLLERVRTELS